MSKIRLYVIFAAIALAIVTPAFVSAQEAASAPQPAPTAAGPVLIAKIVGAISTRKAKVGDTLTAKTVGNYKLADGSEVPKGSKLVAKVTLATSKKDGNGTAILSFRFDQVEMKGGSTVPIHGFVTAIGPALPTGTGGIGQGSVLGRSGQGSSTGIDPGTGLPKSGSQRRKRYRSREHDGRSGPRPSSRRRLDHRAAWREQRHRPRFRRRHQSSGKVVELSGGTEAPPSAVPSRMDGRVRTHHPAWVRDAPVSRTRSSSRLYASSIDGLKHANMTFSIRRLVASRGNCLAHSDLDGRFDRISIHPATDRRKCELLNLCSRAIAKHDR